MARDSHRRWNWRWTLPAAPGCSCPLKKFKSAGKRSAEIDRTTRGTSERGTLSYTARVTRLLFSASARTKACAYCSSLNVERTEGTVTLRVKTRGLNASACSPPACLDKDRGPEVPEYIPPLKSISKVKSPCEVATANCRASGENAVPHTLRVFMNASLDSSPCRTPGRLLFSWSCFLFRRVRASLSASESLWSRASMFTPSTTNLEFLSTRVPSMFLFFVNWKLIVNSNVEVS
mmetsp:Transcript_15749/g.31931  ORF Transcript_15749/g.31931 Transcript_15749/m.31931 type:complete len:234 (-) Transcript_15749:520-1221(-)